MPSVRVMAYRKPADGRGFSCLSVTLILGNVAYGKYSGVQRKTPINNNYMYVYNGLNFAKKGTEDICFLAR